MVFIKVLAVCVAGYLLGSVNVAVLITKFIMNDDVREKGSGNAGATNVARVFGMKLGLVTLLGDVVKTLIAAFVGKLLLGQPGVVLACAVCLVGHCWPAFFSFKGGKGVAVGAAIIAILNWRVILICLGAFLLVVFLTRYVSAASISAAVIFPIALLIVGAPLWYEFLLAIFTMLVVCFLHRGNIKRLMNGTESKFKFKK